MLKENERLMARQFQAFDERMDKQSKLFDGANRDPRKRPSGDSRDDKGIE